MAGECGRGADIDCLHVEIKERTSLSGQPEEVCLSIGDVVIGVAPRELVRLGNLVAALLREGF